MSQYIVNPTSKGEAVFCNSCGAQVKDGARFCPKCGAAIDEAPAITPRPAEQYIESVPAQPVAPVTPAQPVQAPVNTADMPSLGVATLLCVIGLLCGLIWGIYGFIQRGGLKDAIERGDVVTAKAKFNHIMIATIIGIVLNVLIVIGNMAQAGAI